MRDLAKSMMRFSWTLGLFGMRQALNLVPGRDGQAAERSPAERTACAFDEVAAATEAQLDGPVRGLYEAGERLQSSVFDLAFDTLTFGWARGTVRRAGAGDEVAPAAAERDG